MMVLKIGNVRRQVRWLGNVAAMAGGLQIFSQLPGDLSSFLSDTFIRIIVGFNIVTDSIWSYVGDYINIDLNGYEGALTFSCLVMIPYLFRFGKIRMGNVFDEENKILSSLNFVSFIFISNIFSREYVDINSWDISLSAIPILLFLSFITIYGYIKDYYYFNLLRILISIIIFVTLFVSIFTIFINWSEITTIENYVVLIAVTLISNSAYAFGLFFKIEGYYPLLFACVFFGLYYLMDLFLRASPSIDNYLTSIGV